MTREDVIAALREAFDAGVSHGEDSATAYEWGSEDVPRAPDGEWAKFRLLTDDYRRAARAIGPPEDTQP